MCIQCFGKKHILIQGWGINDDFSCFGKGVEEKWQTCLTKFSQARAIFRINIASTATGTGGQIIPWALCLRFPVQPAPSCLRRWWCGAVCAPLWWACGFSLRAGRMQLHGSLPGMSVSGRDWSCLCEAASPRVTGKGFLHNTRCSGCTEVSSDQKV